MKRDTILCSLLLAALLVGPPLVWGQEHHPDGEPAQPPVEMPGMAPGSRMMEEMMKSGGGMMGMMMVGPNPSMILHQRDALRLTDDQMEQIEAIKKETTATHESIMSEMRSLHERAKEALEGEQPDFSSYESALNAAANRHVQMQVSMARAGQQALEVLNAEQRSNLHYGMRVTRQRMMMRAGEGCRMMTPDGMSTPGDSALQGEQHEH